MHVGALTAVSKEIKVHPSDILGVNFSCLPVVQGSEKKHTLEARTQVGTRHHWKLPLTGDRRPHYLQALWLGSPQEPELLLVLLESAHCSRFPRGVPAFQEEETSGILSGSQLKAS